MKGILTRIIKIPLAGFAGIYLCTIILPTLYWLITGISPLTIFDWFDNWELK